MGKFLKALAKVGLVELEGHEVQALENAGAEDMSPEEIQRILAETKNIGGDGEDNRTEPGPPASAASFDPASVTGVVEERELTAIYRDANVPTSPFPAEKLIKLLDGLRAMDMNTRKAAILAMDQADDAWTIEDALLDATRKIEALRTAQQATRANLTAAEGKAQQELQAQDTYQSKVTETIRSQITELEATLQKELESVAEQKASIRSRVESDRAAAQREEARLETEVKRLGEISTIFHTEGS